MDTRHDTHQPAVRVQIAPDGSVHVTGIEMAVLVDLLKSHGLEVDASQAARSPEDILTAREIEIVQLVAQGRSNQEIADQSFLSINTVKSHIRLAYRKIGVKTRSQAVRWAVVNGLDLDETVRHDAR